MAEYQIAVRRMDLEEMAGQWAASILRGFSEWLECRPDSLARRVDLMVLSNAAETGGTVPLQQAMGAARRLSDVAAVSPFADELVPFFDELAQAFMLGGVSRMRGWVDD